MRLPHILLALLFLLTAPASAQTLSLDALKMAYAEPGSRYVRVGNVNVHYVDEGAADANGPPIVLLNASYLNLSSWRAVAARLSGKHRIIRLDFPTVGLSGPAPDADLDIRAFEGLVLGLLDTLGVSRFHLVGTSSGAIVAFRLAADHPDRVARLVLLNAAGLPRTAATDPLRDRERAPDAPKPGTRDFWNNSLADNFADPARLAPGFVTQVHDLNRRADQRREAKVFMQGFSTGDPRAVLAKVRSPTLILWGKKSITLSHLEAEAFGSWLQNAPYFIEKYDDAGHYPQVEQPGLVAQDIADFVMGANDIRLIPPPLATAARLDDLPFWQASNGLWEGENIYIGADGTKKAENYASLSEVRAEAAAYLEREHRFYPASPTAEALAGRTLVAGSGIEVRRTVSGRMADASGRLSIDPQGEGDRISLQPVSGVAAVMTVLNNVGTETYRIHHDLTGADRRLRTVFGLDAGGTLRAVALFNEHRQPLASKAARLAALRQRFNVVATFEAQPDGQLVPLAPAAPDGR